MKRGLISLLWLLIIGSTFAQESKPNILLIAVDDLNDWVGTYGGHPQAKTPNMDSFAGNSMVFRNASCPGPVCGPSRSAFMSGFTPATSGMYGNGDNMICSDLVQKQPTLPEYFSRNGYVTISSGKIIHSPDRGHWAYDIWKRARGNDAVNPATLYSRHEGIINGKEIEGAAMSGTPVDLVWGVTNGAKEDTKDYRTAKWFEDKLQQDYDKPFFMLAGLSKPHLPFVVPQEYYDRYDLETLEVPEFRLDDLDDIVNANGKKKYKPEEDFLWIEEQGLHKEVVRAYLAATSYADDCVGIILDALENSKYANNTIVIIFGDHGWHLSEKLRYRKATLWKESTQLPFIFHMPGMDTKQECFRNVNLQDIYPSLIELCGLPQKGLLDGRSFKPLLEDVNMEWYPAITTLEKNNHSVMYNEWHYISYRDGVEELYNLENDPMEWVNLANIDSTEINAVKQNLKTFLPEVNAPKITTYDISITKEERKVMLRMP
jgi:arylsulfatase A-like enzyme